MELMRREQWQHVVDNDFEVPTSAPLNDLTADLTSLLGSVDPVERDELAYRCLATWIERGHYDELLSGLGDGMCTGLEVGLGETETDTVFRRSFSALILAECLQRDQKYPVLPQKTILSWGDRLMGWYLQEADARGWVPGKGWAHAIAHGADALGVLARSYAIGYGEATVILEVLSERLAGRNPHFTDGEPDRLALAAMHVFRRGDVPLDVVESWINRLTAQSLPCEPAEETAYMISVNSQAFLRALHLQVMLAPDQPPYRTDLLLLLVDALRTTNPWTLALPDKDEPTPG